MKEDSLEFQALLQALAAEAQATAGAHLTVEQLADYHAQKLTAEASEQMQEHLVMCRTCTLQLLDLADLSAQETPNPSLAEATVVSVPPAPSVPPSFFRRLRELFTTSRFIPVFAVLSLLLSISLVVWVISLNREKQVLLAQLRQQQTGREAELAQEITALQLQKNEVQARAEQLAAEAERARRVLLEEQKKAHLNAPVIDVLPQEQRAAGETITEIARSAPRFTLVIPALITEPKYPDYTIEILSKSGTVVISEKGLRLTSGGSFTIALSNQSFAAGEYRVHVYGLGRGAKTRVAGGVIRFR